MVKMVLYEMACGKPSPAEWFRDTRECGFSEMDRTRWPACAKRVL